MKLRTTIETFRGSLPSSPEVCIEPGKFLHITIPGAPRTKKNSNVLITKGNRQFVLPSKAYRDWHRDSQTAILPIMPKIRRYLPIDYPVHVLAIYYREADRGDRPGFDQALYDFLEDVGILCNDVLVRNNDGTRMRKDVENPRIEVYIRPWIAEMDRGLFEPTITELAVGSREPTPEECMVL